MPRRQEWVLDPQVTPTRTVTEGDVQEALEALQIKGTSVGAVGTGATGKILVAIVKHMARGGFQGDPSILTTPPSILCAGAGAVPERPTKDDPVATGGSLRSARRRAERRAAR